MKTYTLIGPNRPFDLIINLIIVAIAVIMSISGYRGILLDILAFYSVYFAAGYALVSALLPGRTALLAQSFTLPRAEKIHEISILERIVFSVALSAVTYGILGVILTRGIFGLNTITASLEVLIFTVIFTIIAVSRRVSWIRDPFVVKFSTDKAHKRTRADIPLMVLVLAALLTFVAVSADALSKEPQHENFVEMYINGTTGNVESLPSVNTGASTVAVTITSHMNEATTFKLVISDGLEYIRTDDFTIGSGTILLTPTEGMSTYVHLEPGQQTELTLVFSLLTSGDHTVYFTLLGGEETLQLWMPIYVPYIE